MVGRIESSRECLFFDALNSMIKSGINDGILFDILRVVGELVKRIKQDSGANDKQYLHKCFHALR